jgi:hypothetical protein
MENSINKIAQLEINRSGLVYSKEYEKLLLRKINCTNKVFTQNCQHQNKVRLEILKILKNNVKSKKPRLP